ncbi:DUF1214 domain-containing protein [Hydrocarboniphaga effusa]|uniref:DUF1214 domain-containing protein n=1 Tax=Hydrocarboniphaga effusa AP103 TaxID=1172194 RepID=I8HWZ0_9GAMM|nr:DUF1214 domain-containing protein [Hydrocarboniphaga effusa]EIT67881.1 hypothetical protein WQQ_43160 [Hydrocarboniphaga effusa AP103]
MSVENDVISGRTWEAFCDALKQAGQQVLRPEAPTDALTRAEGWRYLTRLLRIGLEMHLEFADPEAPGFFAPSHETGKIGADNPDNLYLMGRLDGRYDYRISGSRGGVAYLSFGTQKGGYETDGRMVQTGFLDGAKLELDEQGRFELVLSCQPQIGNWLPMEPTTNAVIVRQTFIDRRAETAAQLRIERIGRDRPPAPLTPERLAAGLERAAKFVGGTASIFADWAQSYLAHANQLPPADQALCQRAGGDPNIFYYHSYWQLADDEALIFHLPRIPDCRFWNLQIDNWWMESLDYRYHRICHNQHSARRNADGSVDLVLAHRDPGHANWLETAGHDRGTMCLRWVGAKEHVHPQTRVVKFANLQQELAR